MTGIDWRELYASNQAVIARARRTPAPPPPAGAAPAAGALVHVPASLDPLRPAPLVCMLHGCTQDPGTFAAATRMNEQADRHGFVVVYPGQPRRANPQSCWNWFLREHQRRDGGEPASIARTVRALMATKRDYVIDPERVFVAGLSSGAAMAAILAACHPDLFAAAAMHSGLAYGSAGTVGAAFAAMARPTADAEQLGRAAHAAMGPHARPVPTMVIHGTADRTVAPANATHLLRQLMTANRLAAPGVCDHDPSLPTASVRGGIDGGRSYTASRWTDRSGRLMHGLLAVDELGHAWSGGAAGGSHTDPHGPDAAAAIIAFFAEAVAGAAG